jgi:hypothetical protein
MEEKEFIENFPAEVALRWERNTSDYDGKVIGEKWIVKRTPQELAEKDGVRKVAIYKIDRFISVRIDTKVVVEEGRDEQHHVV